jgi:hypothetical protein
MWISLKGVKVKNKTLFDLILRVKESEEDDIVSIEIKCDEFATKVEDEYCYTALQKLRRLLFLQGVDICCYGAKKNVHPSPLMMYSSKAYLLTMGKQAKMDDIVEIFDSCELDEIATVEEQNLFYQEWIRSLK